MRGTLFAATGPKRKALVIASQMPDREDGWHAFARELAGAGIATLTFQMPQYRDLGGQRDYTLMDRDLEAAVLFLESRDYPSIYVLGDGTAGTAAIKLASRRQLAGLITVATPPSIAQPNAPVYDARPDLPRVTAPKLFIGSAEQSQAVEELMRLAVAPKQSSTLRGPPSAGVPLLNGADGAGFKQTVREFLLR